VRRSRQVREGLCNPESGTTEKRNNAAARKTLQDGGKQTACQKFNNKFASEQTMKMVQIDLAF
jgi:hypothetical protein